ncbi:MAG: AbrB family transcriptional regulator [Dehalococcoidia bacterium]|nr:AbrB family transcriptional regulator [Dehalococcoidia bacterium]MDH4299864.1 AbrB family transcriptional regulator [Dehalococcoidia bacterium]MDH4367559.1 AbrB family transcriptional regulator [Dehalococcoidia bacterium]
MKRSDMRVIGRCFGTAVLGPRGQLVVPVEARKELSMDSGNKFLVFGHFEGLGLILIKVEAAEKMLNILSSRLDEITKLVKESRKANTGVTE